MLTPLSTSWTLSSLDASTITVPSFRLPLITYVPAAVIVTAEPFITTFPESDSALKPFSVML